MKQGTGTPRALGNVFQLKPEEVSEAKNQWLVFTISQLFTVIKNKADSKELMKEALLLRDWVSPFILATNKEAHEVAYTEKNNSNHVYMMR